MKRARSFLTTAEVAERVGVCRQRIEQMAAARGIMPIRVGRRNLWWSRDLDRFGRLPSGRPRKVGH